MPDYERLTIVMEPEGSPVLYGTHELLERGDFCQEDWECYRCEGCEKSAAEVRMYDCPVVNEHGEWADYGLCYCENCLNDSILFTYRGKDGRFPDEPTYWLVDWTPKEMRDE